MRSVIDWLMFFRLSRKYANSSHCLTENHCIFWGSPYHIGRVGGEPEGDQTLGRYRMKATKQQKADALARLKALLKPGDTIYTQFVSVSRSGMLRKIKVYVVANNQPINITPQVSDLCGFGYDYNTDALKVSGCGTDVGFQAVYELAGVLYPDGFECAGETCPSNDHTNGVCDRNSKHHHNGGGYAFRQAWL
jgi:hypothetical protein